MVSASPTPYTEPWLRGNYADVPAAGRAVLHALDLALDDIAKWTAGLTDAEVRSAPLVLASIRATHRPLRACHHRSSGGWTLERVQSLTQPFPAQRAEPFTLPIPLRNGLPGGNVDLGIREANLELGNLD